MTHIPRKHIENPRRNPDGLEIQRAHIGATSTADIYRSPVRLDNPRATAEEPGRLVLDIQHTAPGPVFLRFRCHTRGDGGPQVETVDIGASECSAEAIAKAVDASRRFYARATLNPDWGLDVVEVSPVGFDFADIQLRLAGAWRDWNPIEPPREEV